MGRRKKGTPPSYRRHKSGQAFAVYRGDYYYFGGYGLAESRRKYQEFLSWWERQEAHVGPVEVRTLADFVAAFLLHAREFYRNADGQPTSRFGLYRNYLGQVLRLFGARDVEDFGRAELKIVQAQWAETLCRRTCNQALAAVKTAFRWGADEGLIRVETLASVLTVKGIPQGRSLAKEYEPVLSVPHEQVQAVIAELSAPFADMVRAQELIGCRPGELRSLRGDEINRNGQARLHGQVVHESGLWAWLPTQHKVRHTGRVVLYWIGPQAQAVLSPHLLRAGEGRVFCRPDGTCYSEQRYIQVIEYAAKRAGVPSFTPNQLRHNTATRYDEVAGLQAASTVLGHARVETTAVYAQKNLAQAASLVRRLG